jgi:adenylate cyclase
MLQHFVPSERESHIVSAVAEELRKGDRHRVAVIFAEIRGVSRLSANMTPERVALLLNSFRDRVARVVGSCGGVIDKFIADGVLVVFGISEPRREDAASALRAAVDLSDEIARWSAKRTREGRAPVAIGRGLRCCEVFVGAPGGEPMEFTVIGDVVNIAYVPATRA